MDTPSTLPTILLLGVIAVLFVYGWRRRARAMPIASLLVSVGIFGTFLGIAYALFMFDVDAIDESIPALLSGMRIAFVTSVAGIFFAVLLRTRDILEGWTERTGAEALDDAEDDARRALDVQEMRHAEITQELLALRRALSSGGDASLVTQLRLLRQESAQHALQLQRELRNLRDALHDPAGSRGGGPEAP